jgi:hypothetical protein
VRVTRSGLSCERLVQPLGERHAAAALSGLSSGNPESVMFLFFSNRLGCIGSIAVSIVVTLILLAIFDLI